VGVLNLLRELLVLPLRRDEVAHHREAPDTPPTLARDVEQDGEEVFTPRFVDECAVLALDRDDVATVVTVGLARLRLPALFVLVLLVVLLDRSARQMPGLEDVDAMRRHRRWRRRVLLRAPRFGLARGA
jgi:hypothetical protein